jgi:hypothetical protein
MKSEVPRKLKVGLKITGSSTLIFRLWFTSAGHEIGYSNSPEPRSQTTL